MGTLRSPETIRKEIVEYLKSNPFDSNGFPFWSIWQMIRSLADSMTHMARDGTYGDQITLYAAANLYNIGGQHAFNPSASVSAATVYLGHFAENQGG